MGFWKNTEPAFKISQQTQNGVCEYLLKEAAERAKSEDPELRESGERLRKAATEFLIDIKKPQKASRILKALRKGMVEALDSRKLDAQDTCRAVAEIFFIEVMLKDLGVTNFES